MVVERVANLAVAWVASLADRSAGHLAAGSVVLRAALLVDRKGVQKVENWAVGRVGS